MQNEKGYTLAGHKIFFGIPAYDHNLFDAVCPTGATAWD
jgi:hypothetical protein